MILGESQIQDRYGGLEASRAQAGPVLHRLFQTALHVGSRVRTETGLGMGTASAASAVSPLRARSLAISPAVARSFSAR